jgi:hypothetical protein
MRGRRKVSSLTLPLPKLNFLHKSSNGMVVGNDVCIYSLQLQSEVVDSLKKDLQGKPVKAEMFRL